MKDADHQEVIEGLEGLQKDIEQKLWDIQMKEWEILQAIDRQRKQLRKQA